MTQPVGATTRRPSDRGRILAVMTTGPVDPAAAALDRAKRASRTVARRRPRSGPQFSGSGPDARDPKPLGGVFDDWVRGNDYTEQLTVFGLMDRWSDIVGEQVAAHTAMVQYRPAPTGGVVVVRADSAAWALQLRYLADDLVRRIAEHAGAGLVTQVEVQGPAATRSGGRLRVRTGRRSPRR